MMEFNDASRTILKARNHALQDNRICIDAPLNFPARIELLNISYFFRLTHPTPGIKPGGRIVMCEYSSSSVSENLKTLPRW